MSHDLVSLLAWYLEEHSYVPKILRWTHSFCDLWVKRRYDEKETDIYVGSLSNTKFVTIPTTNDRREFYAASPTFFEDSLVIIDEYLSRNAGSLSISAMDPL